MLWFVSLLDLAQDATPIGVLLGEGVTQDEVLEEIRRQQIVPEPFEAQISLLPEAYAAEERAALGEPALWELVPWPRLQEMGYFRRGDLSEELGEIVDAVHDLTARQTFSVEEGQSQRLG